jgi:hypothetical protein
MLSYPELVSSPIFEIEAADIKSIPDVKWSPSDVNIITL